MQRVPTEMYGIVTVAGKFFWFLLFLLLTLDYFTHVGIMSVNLSSNLQIATTILSYLECAFWLLHS